MYKHTIWPPVRSFNPNKPLLMEGNIVCAKDNRLFVTLRCFPSLSDRDQPLRLFLINQTGHLMSGNRQTDLPANQTDHYKDCLAIWESLDDFLDDMPKEVVRD